MDARSSTSPNTPKFSTALENAKCMLSEHRSAPPGSHLTRYRNALEQTYTESRSRSDENSLKRVSTNTAKLLKSIEKIKSILAGYRPAPPRSHFRRHRDAYEKKQANLQSRSDMSKLGRVCGSSFLQLPAELRHMIYTLVLLPAHLNSSPERLNFRFGFGGLRMTRQAVPGILLVNHQINQEASGYFLPSKRLSLRLCTPVISQALGYGPRDGDVETENFMSVKEAFEMWRPSEMQHRETLDLIMHFSEIILNPIRAESSGEHGWSSTAPGQLLSFLKLWDSRCGRHGRRLIIDLYRLQACSYEYKSIRSPFNHEIALPIIKILTFWLATNPRMVILRMWAQTVDCSYDSVACLAFNDFYWAHPHYHEPGYKTLRWEIKLARSGPAKAEARNHEQNPYKAKIGDSGMDLKAWGTIDFKDEKQRRRVIDCLIRRI